MSNKNSNREVLVRKFYKTFEEAVAKRIGGVKKLGVFLSGGIDSGALLSVAKRLDPNKKLYAFTIGPWGEGSSDLPYARINAEHSGGQLKEFYGSPKILGNLPEVIKLLGQPNSDTSSLVFYSLSKEARRHGVEAMLSGQNADTIMGAIHYVKTLKRWADLRRIIAPFDLLLKVATHFLQPNINLKPLSSQ